MVGILFVMTADPTIRSATFADIGKYSFFEQENEILFSMHAVFRIGHVLRSDEGQRLFEVQLTRTTDDDPELRHLTDRMEEEIDSGIGWDRLG